MLITINKECQNIKFTKNIIKIGINPKIADRKLCLDYFVILTLSQSPEPMRRVSEGSAKELSNWTFLVFWWKGWDSSLRLRSVQNDKIRRFRRCAKPKPWAKALSLCEGSAKGLLRDDKITREEIPIGKFKNLFQFLLYIW